MKFKSTTAAQIADEAVKSFAGVGGSIDDLGWSGKNGFTLRRSGGQ